VKRLLTLMLMCVLAAVWVSQPAVAAEKLLRVAPKTINFGTVPVGTEVLKGATITNVSGSDVLLLVEGGLPDDFGCCPGQRVPRSRPATSSARAPAATSWSASPRPSSSPDGVRPEPSRRHCGIRRPERCFPQF
jgi:hypothetical protein